MGRRCDTTLNVISAKNFEDKEVHQISDRNKTQVGIEKFKL